jgi:hypothetical protein
MAMLETATFRLAPGVDEAAFLDADSRVQTEFVYQQPGLVRRTTARGRDGDWIVIVLWASDADADAAAARAPGDEAAVAFTACLDPGSVRTARYALLD